MPLDRGGAAIEIDVIDPQTGTRLAASTSEYFPPLTKLTAPFQKLAPAELALRKNGIGVFTGT